LATPENTFIQSVHRLLPVELYRIKNNNMFHAGQPDVWYSGDRADLWVEYKFIALPKRGDTLIVPGLSELQKNWLKCRYAEGRNVGVIIGCKEGGVWFPGVSWEEPLTAEYFREVVVPRATLAATIQIITQK